MKTVSLVCADRPIPDTLARFGRSYSFARLPPGSQFDAVLIVQAEQSAPDVYAVEDVGQADGWEPGARRIFLVGKCGEPGEFEGKNVKADGLYCVTVPGRAWHTGPPSCTCVGFGRWQNCRHALCIVDLLQQGDL